jgi:hypothetical protein
MERRALRTGLAQTDPYLLGETFGHCTGSYLAPRFPDWPMNPDKLFDYLDGKLSPTERAQLEARLASDSHLQRELAVARQIHAGMRDSREVFAPFDPGSTTSARGAVLGRRVMIAFTALVFLNVFFGLYAIFFMKNKREKPSANEQNRQQLVEALQKTAASALPTPNLEVDEIAIPASKAQRDTIANQVIAEAAQCGGSAVKNLNDENGLLLFAEIPAAREGEFRQKLTSLGAQPTKATASSASSPGRNRIIQIRLVGDVNR